MNDSELTNGEEQCKFALENIKTLIDALSAANQADDSDLIDTAHTAIYEYPLSVEVRDNNWYLPSSGAEHTPDEFRILLVFGGPLVQIRGTIFDCEFVAENLEWQDWGTQITTYKVSAEELEYLRAFANLFGGI